MTRFVTIDFTNIAPPDIVETLNFEVIFDEIKADFVQRYPQFDVATLETDPMVAVMRTVAYREMLLRARVNDVARAVMLSLATGADLDHLATLHKVVRKDGETDAEFRQRIHFQIEAFGSAGPRGAYIFHAIDAAPTIFDANAVFHRPGRVRVVLLGAHDGAPTADEIEAVRARLAQDNVRPLTDVVSVEPVKLMPVRIEATLVLLPGPDAALVKSRAEEAVVALLGTRRRVGRNLSRSAIIAALHVEGVERVMLTTPAEDVIVDEDEAVRADSITLTVASARDQ